MPSTTPSSLPKQSDLSRPWFLLGMAGIFIASLALRFWGLSRFNTLVFDEVYYARFASHFLKGELIFTGHPPLSTYIIAIGIWLSNHFNWSGEVKNGLAGLFLSPLSYRWLNAVTGAFLPLLIGAITYQLSHRRSFALITTLLIAADGLFLVESRYALNNVYLLTLGLLGQLFFLISIAAKSWQRWLWLGVAGVFFGATAAIKWNGLGFLLGALSVWFAAWVLRGLEALQSKAKPDQWVTRSPLPLPLQNLTQIHVGHILISFILIPALTYYLSWLPYIQLDPTNTFWNLQAQTLDYHQRVGGINAHPYCSLWYTWPLMLRPIAYFYQTAHQINAPPPVMGPPTPNDAGAVIYDVHAMGNPFLWWLSTAAIVLVIALLVQRLWQWLFTPSQPIPSHSVTPSSSTPSSHPVLNSYDWIALYLAVNWGANLLPWIKVTRCVFLYHYMPSLTFAVMALAFVTDRWLASPLQQRRILGSTIIVIVLASFLFWLPLYLGLPLTPIELQIRRWLPTWI